MPIIFYCPKCGREIRVRSSAAGRSGTCLKCGEAIVVPDVNLLVHRNPRLAKAAVGPHKPMKVASSPDTPTIEDGFATDGAE